MNETKILLVKGDITLLETDAIVNAANSSLLGGGGVDGAIHRAAGPELLVACRMIGGCPTGEARITKGYNLKAKFVIHTVGPVWHGGYSNEMGKLAACYYNSLKLADDNHCSSIAFPNISTGVFGYPKAEAARIAIKTVNEYLAGKNSIKQVFFCCFDEENYLLYTKALAE